MKLSLAFCTLILAHPLAAHGSSCCEHKEETSAQTATDSLYQLDASWTDQNGRAFKLPELKGRPVLMAMGYATCKFACPRLAADLLTIEGKLTPREREGLAIVFISIDPTRDTPGQIKAFLDQYQVNHQRWHGLRGEEDAVLELSVALGIRYRKVNEADFAHSNVIALLSPSGEILQRLEGLAADPEPLLKILRPLLQAKAPDRIP